MLKKQIVAAMLVLATGVAHAGQGGSFYNPDYDVEGGCALASSNDQDWYQNNNWQIPALANGQSIWVQSTATWYNGASAQGYYATFYCTDGTIWTNDVWYYEPAYQPYWYPYW